MKNKQARKIKRCQAAHAFMKMVIDCESGSTDMGRVACDVHEIKPANSSSTRDTQTQRHRLKSWRDSWETRSNAQTRINCLSVTKT